MFSQVSVILFTGGLADTHTPVQLVRHPPEQTSPTPTPQETATAADSTHPTGMHSCENIFSAVPWTENSV